MCKSLVEQFNDTIKVWIIFSIFPPSVLILTRNLKKGLVLCFRKLSWLFLQSVSPLNISCFLILMHGDKIDYSWTKNRALKSVLFSARWDEFKCNCNLMLKDTHWKTHLQIKLKKSLKKILLWIFRYLVHYINNM